MEIGKRKIEVALRVALFWGAFWLLLFGLRRIPVPVAPELGNLLFGCLGTLGAFILVKIFLGAESKTFPDIGLVWASGSLRRFMLGSAGGMALAGLMLAVVVPLAGFTVVPTPDPDYWNAIGFAILVLFVLALMEEVAFRSYPLVRLYRSFGTRTSIYGTSLFFALYHGIDPANLLGPGVWGILFGVAAIGSRGIALPLGLHFGLNWMQSLFGMKTQFAGSIWTIVPGAGEGIESANFIGLVLQFLLLVVGILLVERHIRRHPALAEVPVHRRLNEDVSGSAQ
ncbi:MAG: CPBP family intramembrane glutamic endopeptidase [Verrucomicrobiales bacterium]